MDEKIKAKLDSLIDQPMIYKNKNLTIQKYKYVGGTNIIIFANNRVFANFLYSEIDDFLNELCIPNNEKLKPLQIGIPEQKLIIFEPTKENEEIKLTLMETLKKVKESPTYISQAQTICNVVEQIVNVQKTEIQMLQLVNKIKI